MLKRSSRSVPRSTFLRLATGALLALFAVTPAAVAQDRGFRFGDDAAAWIEDVDAGDLDVLSKVGVDFDGMFGSRARVYVNDVALLNEVEKLGFRVTPIPRVVPNFEGGGYPTVAQLGSDLQAIAAAHPNLCQLFSIGKSVQGRDLWILKISDNVTVEEDEPEFKYISSMHGDETVGIVLMMDLIEELMSEYGSDPQITRLVNEVEIWIMPLMNPDGYNAGSRYNAQGVDLNRDFPDRISDPVNTTAGRAPEVAHVMNWAFQQSTVLSANLHTGALCVNYPYDSDPNPFASYSATPDDSLFVDQSLTYSTLNTPMYNSFWFNQGITNGVEWYLVHGGMQDWNYHWLGCNEVTIELNDTKWPPASQLPGLWNDNRGSMLAYMDLCLKGVRGVITDQQTGDPLAATIRVVGIDHDVYTDPDVGDYHRMIEPGSYHLRITAPGYRKKVLPVVVGSGDATRLDVSLIPNGGLYRELPDLQGTLR